MSGTVTEVFSVSRAGILAPTGNEDQQLYACHGATLRLNITPVTCASDDTEVTTWYQVTDAHLTVTGHFISMEAIAYYSGFVLASDGNGSYGMTEVALALENLPPVPVAVRCPSKDETGSPGSVDIILYAVQLQVHQFTQGLSAKSGLVISYEGSATFASTDEAGRTLDAPAIGAIRSWSLPQAGAINTPTYGAVASSDSASAAESAAITVTLAAAEDVTAADAGASPGNRTITSSDFAGGNDGSQPLALAAADSAAISESASRMVATLITSSDSARGSDSELTAWPQSAESAASAEAHVLALTSSEVSHATDGKASTTTEQLSSSDFAGGNDGYLTTGIIAAAESAAAADAGAVAGIPVTSADTAHAADGK